MRFLFMHEFFPGQYRHLAAALARDPRHEVVFATSDRTAGGLPRVAKLIYTPRRPEGGTAHRYLVPAEGAVVSGQAAFRACLALRKRGFVPDVICAHAGFGPALFVKEVFPDARLVGYFEWFYRARGSDADYLDPAAIDQDEACRIRARNAPILMDLAQADIAVCPTAFQRDQFPPKFRDGIVQLHDGIDTDFFSPAGDGDALPSGLPDDAEVITYATRGMEPYRGFPHFMAAAAAVLARRPKAHVVIAGGDTVHYSRKPPGGETYKSRALRQVNEADRPRLHFTGTLPLDRYRALLRRSDVHVYLTVPFVLSWSLLEAMACGCLVVGADTAPVREVMADGREGLLVDFRDPAALAERLCDALDLGDRGRELRRAARHRAEEGYALSRLLPRHLQLVGVDRGAIAGLR